MILICKKLVIFVATDKPMRKTILRIFFFTATCAVILIAQTNNSGPGSGYTNAPGESNCSQSGCHTGTALQTSGTKWDNIKLTGNFTGNGYIPDSTYTLKFKYVEKTKSKWGYQITALDETKGDMAGTFTNPAGGNSQAYSYSISSKNRTSLGHTSTSNSTADSIEWSIRWKAPSTNVGKIKFYATLNVADGTGGTGSDIIYAKTFSFGPSTLLPTAKVKIQDSVNCSGIALTFDATKTGSPSTYAWQFPGGGSPSSSTSANPKVTYNTTGTYKAILRVKNNKGFSDFDTLTFNVVQGATSPTLNVGSSVNICKGDSLTLLCKTPATGHTYSWSPGNQINQSIKIADSGVYSVTVRNSNKCFRTSSIVTVKIKDKPGITLLKSFSGDTVCSGSPFSLAAFITSPPADSFSFTSNLGPFSKKDTLNQILLNGKKTFSAWAKNSFGCVSPQANATVVAKAPEVAPTVSVGNITYTSMKFSWPSIPKATAYRISFDTGKTWISTLNSGTDSFYVLSGLIGNTTIQAYVIGLTTGQCSQSSTGIAVGTTLTCTPINYTVSAQNAVVCKNGSGQIVLNGLSGKKIGIKIDGVAKTTDTLQNVKVTGTKFFTVSVIDSNSLVCGYTNKQVLFTEDTVRTPISNLGATASFCTNNSSVSLPVNANKHKSADSVIFTVNNSIAATNTSGTYTYAALKNDDSVWVSGKNTRGCLSDPSAKTMVVINVIPDATFTSSNINFQYKYKAAKKGTHTWTIDTMTRAGDSCLFDLTKYATKSVKIKHVITFNGCTNSDSATFTVPDFNGLVKSNPLSVRIYPNPANDIVNIVVKDFKGNAYINFYNTTGQLLQTNPIKTGSNSIKTLGLPAGILHYTIVTSLSQTTGSLVIER
jgi:PKD domain/Secretion system C-terminal sorting domain/Reeler domain